MRFKEPMPSDLSIVLILNALGLIFTLVWPLSDLPIRALIGLVVVLFLTGYSLAAAIFPRTNDLSHLSRAVLSVVFSVALTLLIGLSLNYSSWGLRLEPITISFFLLTTGLIFIAHFRRYRLPIDARFGTDFNWDIRSFLLFQDPLLPTLLIVLAELLIFKGHFEAAMAVHGFNLIVLTISSAFLESRIPQALMLLPLFRLLNAAMPIFFELTLYSYALVYAPMFLPMYLILKSKRFSYEEIGMRTKGFWCYIPAVVILGLIMGWGEFQVIHPEMLTPIVDLENALKLSLIMIFFVGLVEEFVFRSVLQTVTMEWMGPVKGLITASLLFGLMHSGYGILSEMVFVSVAGLVFGLFFWKTKSLPLAALLHGITNISLFLIVPLLLTPN